MIFTPFMDAGLIPMMDVGEGAKAIRPTTDERRNGSHAGLASRDDKNQRNSNAAVGKERRRKEREREKVVSQSANQPKQNTKCKTKKIKN